MTILMVLLTAGSLLIIPLIVILGGKVLLAQADGEPNNAVGFRTKRSMSSQGAWQYANKRCAYLWQRTGRIMLIVSAGAAASTLLIPEDSSGIEFMWVIVAVTLAQTVWMLLDIAKVERELRVRFKTE